MHGTEVHCTLMLLTGRTTLPLSSRTAMVLLAVLFTGACDWFRPEKSVFDTRYAVQSPNGSVPFGSRAYSPDATRYAREVSPEGTGNIGVFRLADATLLVRFNALDSSCSNDLKGLAWSPDSRHLAVMYHGGMKPGIYMYTADSGKEERYIGAGSGSAGYYHFMVFDSSGSYVYVSSDGRVIADSFATGLR